MILCCGEALTLFIRNNEVAGDQGVIHFSIPAKQWWDNIVFT